MSADSELSKRPQKPAGDTSGQAAPSRRDVLLTSSALVAASALGRAVLGPTAAKAEDKAAPASGKKPNIFVIWGDDIGQANISAYTKGLMGYHTPNIDRSPMKA